MTKHCLIKPFGFIGDTVFASGVAKKLKVEGQFDCCDIVVGFNQVQKLMKLNPWIDDVFTVPQLAINPSYHIDPIGWDRVFTLTETIKTIPPPLQFQMECGVKDPDTLYEIWTDPTVDDQVTEKYQKPYVAVMNIPSWTRKAFLFTEEQYKQAINVPYLGYGGALRNIEGIVKELAKDFNIVYVGLEENSISSIGASQQHGKVRSLLWEVSVLKFAQFFIGAEGGLANFAAGVGTNTILTSDFVWQLYGPKGCIKACEEPKLGPRYYFPNAGHVDLDPFLTDEQVLNAYKTILSGAYNAVV